MDKRGPLIVGVDPAEMGKDRTAIVFRRGRVVSVEVHRQKTTMGGGWHRRPDHRDRAPDAVFVDSVGIGAGIYSACANWDSRWCSRCGLG